jgi:hypothetical protein
MYAKASAAVAFARGASTGRCGASSAAARAAYQAVDAAA